MLRALRAQELFCGRFARPASGLPLSSDLQKAASPPAQDASSQRLLGPQRGSQAWSPAPSGGLAARPPCADRSGMIFSVPVAIETAASTVGWGPATVETEEEGRTGDSDARIWLVRSFLSVWIVPLSKPDFEVAVSVGVDCPDPHSVAGHR